MSGDLPATIENLFVCPFCGKGVMSISAVGFGSRREYLIFRIECEDARHDSVHRACPSMDEGGAYFLHVFPDGHCHAYYY